MRAPTPEEAIMTKLVLTKIAPWPTGRILAVLYLVIGIVVMPIMMIAALVAPEANPAGKMGGLFVAFLMPFIYAVIGFVAGVIGAALYNGIARLLGGIPLTFASETVDETPAS
jgi:hypothetical protein